VIFNWLPSFADQPQPQRGPIGRNVIRALKVLADEQRQFGRPALREVDGKRLQHGPARLVGFELGVPGIEKPVAAVGWRDWISAIGQRQRPRRRQRPRVCEARRAERHVIVVHLKSVDAHERVILRQPRDQLVRGHGA
jgi:hypothetical protein